MKIPCMIVVILNVIVNSVFNFEMELTLPGVIPENDDTYFCASFPIPNHKNNSYIKSFLSTTNSSIVHHMLIFGCKKPYSTEPYYICSKICDSGEEETIYFAWANDQEKFVYPDDFGMVTAGDTGVTHFVLQVHYLKKRTMKDFAGIIIELSTEKPLQVIKTVRLSKTEGSIPGNETRAKFDVSCRYEGKEEVYVFAFRVHAHTLCRSISGFRVSNATGRVDLIGKANPQWPQNFYRPNTYVTMKPGDVLMSRCIYDSTSRNHSTVIGPTHHDEMCLFYIMVVSKNESGDLGYHSCGKNDFKELWNKIPSFSMVYSEDDPSYNLYLASAHVKPISVDSSWKIQESIGDVSGVAILQNSYDNVQYSVLVLHRGIRSWDSSTFYGRNYIGDRNPITTETIVEVDPKTGKVLRKAGANIFIMPHGITVTKNREYVWITDVALHQVMRFRLLNANNKTLMMEKSDLILGERFVPGNDKGHFCQPAKVAVDSKGFIFVADGYCNSRVVHFNPDGIYVRELKETMSVVHSITIEEDKFGYMENNIVWVADRSNRRIVGFRYDGTVAFKSSPTQLDISVYAIEFNPMNRLIYGVTYDGESVGETFVFDYSTNVMTKSWHSNYTMKAPHDLCIVEDGNVIFVAEMYAKAVMKFTNLAPKFIIKSVEKNSELVEYVSGLGSMTIVLIAFISIFSILMAILITQIIKACYKKCKNIQRYAPRYLGKNGFEPLSQNEDNENDENDLFKSEELSSTTNNGFRKHNI